MDNYYLLAAPLAVFLFGLYIKRPAVSSACQSSLSRMFDDLFRYRRIVYLLWSTLRYDAP